MLFSFISSLYRFREIFIHHEQLNRSDVLVFARKCHSLRNMFYCPTLVLWHAYHNDRMTHVYDFDESPDHSNPNMELNLSSINNLSHFWTTQPVKSYVLVTINTVETFVSVPPLSEFPNIRMFCCLHNTFPIRTFCYPHNVP